MTRIFALVVACAAGSCMVTSDAATAVSMNTSGTLPATAGAKTRAAKETARKALFLQLAPADEYFGPLKLSMIGIRNTIRDLGLRYDVNHDIAAQTFASAALAELSIRDWERHYPHDIQLPKSVFFLQRLYTKVLTPESRLRARLVANWMFSDFGPSPQARQLKKTLSAEHLAPLPTPSPTPEPTPTAVPASPTMPAPLSTPGPGPASPSSFPSPPPAVSATPNSS